MSAYDLDPMATANMLDQARLNPLSPEGLPPAWYAGAWKAPVTGLASTVNDVALLASDAMTPTLRATVGKPLDNLFGTKIDEWMVKDQQKVHDNIKGWAPDPRTTGVLGQVTHGLFNVIPEAVIGGPALAGMLQGYKGMQGGIADGLDPTTALGKGVLDGVATWAGMKIPMTLAPKFGAAVNIGTGAAVNVGFGMTTRAATGAFLRERGYTDMADQYKVLDSTAMTVDLIMGGGFGALAHYGAHGARARAETMTDRVAPSDVDAALTMSDQLHIELDTAPGIPTNPAARAAHVDSLNRAVESLLRDEPVMVDPAVVRAEFLENPTAVETRVEVLRAVEDHMGPEWKVFEAELRARGLALDDVDTSPVVRFEPAPREPAQAAEARPGEQAAPEAPAPAAEKKYSDMDHFEKARAREAKLAGQLETANKNAAARAAAREAKTAASDNGHTEAHEVAAHADQIDPAPILLDHPDMSIPAGDRSLPAHEVLAQSDAEIATAKQDSQGFEAAASCALRN